MQANTQASSPDFSQERIGPEVSSREIDEFIYLISHDVRASVRALLELPQWIQEDLEEAGVKLNGPVASSIELLDRHMGRLDRMLMDLLTYSRVGRMQEVEQFEIATCLEQVLEDLKFPNGFDISEDLMCMDATMGQRDMLTLMGALIQNAYKHHDKTSGRIHLSTRKEDDALAFRVSDDGPGIPDAFHDRVFGAMQTLKPRDEVEGSGMGLTIVRRIAEIYGGTAYVDQPLFGRGTTICVRIPQPRS